MVDAALDTHLLHHATCPAQQFLVVGQDPHLPGGREQDVVGDVDCHRECARRHQ